MEEVKSFKEALKCRALPAVANFLLPIYPCLMKYRLNLLPLQLTNWETNRRKKKCILAMFSWFPRPLPFFLSLFNFVQVIAANSVWLPVILTGLAVFIIGILPNNISNAFLGPTCLIIIANEYYLWLRQIVALISECFEWQMSQTFQGAPEWHNSKDSRLLPSCWKYWLCSCRVEWIVWFLAAHARFLNPPSTKLSFNWVLYNNWKDNIKASCYFRKHYYKHIDYDNTGLIIKIDVYLGTSQIAILSGESVR